MRKVSWERPRVIHRVLAALAVSSCCLLPALDAAQRPRTGNPWSDMDYGPFLTASIEAAGPGTNIAYKGIAIRLANAFGVTNNEAVVFDTDLLRYASAWTGNFVALKGVVFDGEHWAYPRIDGEQAFGNGQQPGWGRNGQFADPREFPYGPLPRDWAHWNGLYLHGQKVVLSYSVGGTKVLELPGLELAGKVRLFTRTLEMGPSQGVLELQLAEDPSWDAGLRRVGSPHEPASELPADGSLVFLPASPGPGGGPEHGASSNATAIAWGFDEAAGPRATGQPGACSLMIHRGRWTPGVTGTALDLQGDGYAEGPIPTQVDFLAEDLTVSASVRTRSDGVIWAETPAAGPWAPNAKALFVRDGHLVFDVGWVGAVEGRQRLDHGRWAHVAVTWNRLNSEVSLFVDGRLDGRGTLRPTGAVESRVMRVGLAATNFPANPFFRGQLDDLRIHRGVLGEPALRQLAGAGRNPTVLAVSGVGMPAGARWILTRDGALRLRLPPIAEALRFKLLLGCVTTNQLGTVAAHLPLSPAPEPLEPLTHGGPPRWPESLALQGQLGTNAGPFVIDTIAWPAENPWNSWMRPGGFDFFADGRRAAVSTWSGDVWIVDGITDSLERLTWRRFATGLYQPLGLRIVDDTVHVVGRDQITRLRDLNGDGEADAYENFNNDTFNSEHFHEFVLDLQTDAQGNFLYMKGARHARDALHPHHGTLVKVSPDGQRSEVVARGFRAPNGLGLGPAGEAYTTDQEGYWMPANRLNLIRPGGFHGNTWAWWPGSKPTTFEPPICWIHPKVDRSPSTMIHVSSDRWGPLQGRLLSLSYGVGRIFLVPTETVDGALQGGVTPLPLEFETGIMRARFHPKDGQLYVCGLFGWAGNKTQPGGFHRVRYTGAPLHMPVSLNALNQGVLLGFSDPLDPNTAGDVGNYGVERWNYRWTENYGSPDFKADGEKGRDRLEVRAARLSPDRRQVFLELPGILPAMQMHVQMNVRSAEGSPIQTYVHHTIHRLGPSAPAWATASVTSSPSPAGARLRREAPGLKQVLSMAAGAVSAGDARVTRLIQVRAPVRVSPSPFLPPGPFTAAWTGFIRLDVSESFRFHAQGTGRAEVRVNGQIAVAGADLAPEGTPGPLLALKGGLNPIEVHYESPQQADARLRVLWSNDAVAPEPLPPTALVHEADDAALEHGSLRRLGRELFATRHCTSCHAPPPSLTPGITNGNTPAAPHGAMPELASKASSLEAAGDRFHAAWIAQWLLDPRASIEDAWMPRCLPAGPEAATEAADIASFLASLHEPAAPASQGLSPESSDAAQGADLFSKIGCAACHLVAGESRLQDDDRRSLGHVKNKWQPQALAAFLLAPGRHHPWSRMPDFKLAAEEAAALAAHLLQGSATTTAPGSDAAASPATGAQGGDARRGRERVSSRGCAQCHAIPGVPAREFAFPLARLAGQAWQTGCLAESAAARGNAPDFALAAGQRAALRIFLEQDTPTLARDPPSEFYQRQFRSLRCHACHAREDTRDFWSRLESMGAASKPKAVNPYDDQESAAEATIHRQRPPLTWTGDKLRVPWMEELFLGRLNYKPRPKLDARMPAFPAYARGLAIGIAMDHGLDATEAPEAPPSGEWVAAGRDLVRKGALGCVDCHAVGDQPALAGADTVTINFQYVPERLRPDYFHRYLQDPQRLLPGTMMPSFVNDAGQTGITNYFGGEARKQFEAIRQFMRSLAR